jgi:pyrroloquinoline quinone (PQQ) biosynthesis protein C
MDTREGTSHIQLEHQAAGQQRPSGMPLVSGAHPAHMNMSQSTQSQPLVSPADMNRLHVQADALAISQPRAVPYGPIEGQHQAQPDANTCNYFMQHQEQQVGGGGHRELYCYPPLKAWNSAAYGAIEGQDQAQPDANTYNYFMQHQQQQVGGGGHMELYGDPAQNA